MDRTMSEFDFIPLNDYQRIPEQDMIERSQAFYELMKKRRTVREFSSEPVSREIIENCLLTAGTAPNGANMQPWFFVVVSDPAIKKKIREQAEEVEAEFYNKKAPEYWLKALEPLGTDEHKEYLEEAPYLIVIFTQKHTVEPDGTTLNHYYINESVGIATGLLITSLHNAGLVCLTHTPKPMFFLRDILNRPKHETPFMILTVGYPKENTKVPSITKKSLDKIATFL